MDQMELFDAPEHKDANEAGTFALSLQMANLFELSVDAFYAVVHARMSELPIQGEISRFIEKVGKARDRAEASRIASDRGDPDVLAVLKATRKVQVEIHRITGFLRFSPDPYGVYTARCEPDYFILPALAEHFTLRFGETPWAIIDEKRGLCLCRQNGPETTVSVEIRLVPGSTNPAGAAAKNEDKDSWEDLWRLYHRSVCIETRKNPGLQRQFMPERYQKYLNEL